MEDFYFIKRNFFEKTDEYPLCLTLNIFKSNFYHLILTLYLKIYKKTSKFLVTQVFWVLLWTFFIRCTSLIKPRFPKWCS
jgi:hypothetical protein